MVASSTGPTPARTAPDRHARVVAVFTDAMSARYRVCALVLLAAALVTACWYSEAE